MNNSPNGFDLYLVNHAGQQVRDAWVIYIAVVPGDNNGFKGEVRRRRHGDNISFSPPFSQDPAYILSAQPGVIAGAVNNRRDGFTLSLYSHTGVPASDVWTQWLGYSLTPGTTVQPPPPPPQQPWISYVEVTRGTFADNDRGANAYQRGENLTRAWIFASAVGLQDNTSSLRVFDYITFRVVAPDTNIYRANITMEVDARGTIDGVWYVTPVGGSYRAYGVNIVAGIMEGRNFSQVDSTFGYRRVIWQASNDPLRDFLITTTTAILGGAVGYYGPSTPAFQALVNVVFTYSTLPGVEAGVNNRYRVQFRNVLLRGNQEYSIYVYLHGITRLVAAGIAAGMEEIDFWYWQPHFLYDFTGDPLNGRGIRIVNYNISFE